MKQRAGEWVNQLLFSPHRQLSYTWSMQVRDSTWGKKRLRRTRQSNSRLSSLSEERSQAELLPQLVGLVGLDARPGFIFHSESWGVEPRNPPLILSRKRVVVLPHSDFDDNVPALCHQLLR